jgi:hypothetical protein
MNTHITTGTCDTCNVKKFPVVVTPELRGERRGCAKCEAVRFEAQARKDIDTWLAGGEFPRLFVQTSQPTRYNRTMEDKLSFDETEANVILEALTKQVRDTEWDLLGDADWEQLVSLKAMIARIHEFLDGDLR